MLHIAFSSVAFRGSEMCKYLLYFALHDLESKIKLSKLTVILVITVVKNIVTVH